MKYLLKSVSLALLLSFSSLLNAQSEAGSVFLLISPGARAGGMGEADAQRQAHRLRGVRRTGPE